MQPNAHPATPSRPRGSRKRPVAQPNPGGRGPTPGTVLGEAVLTILAFLLIALAADLPAALPGA